MIGNKWDILLKEEYQKDYFKKLIEFVKVEYKSKTIYPKQNEIFNAFRYTDFDNCKVVILGQDPYINPGEAHGYAFSVYDHHLTPSLRNIYKEMSSDLGCDVSLDGDISYLSSDGVMLLNTILTVRSGESMSHKGHGWEILTDNTIKALNDREKPIVFILWGNHARKKKELITNKRHLIIESSHPSPLGASKGFFGSKPFSKCNSFLIQNGMKPINWIKNKRDLFNI